MFPGCCQVSTGSVCVFIEAISRDDSKDMLSQKDTLKVEAAYTRVADYETLLGLPSCAQAGAAPGPQCRAAAQGMWGGAGETREVFLSHRNP